MMYLNPSYFIFLTWVLVGPSELHFLPFILVSTALVAAFAMKHSFQRRTFLLMAVFGIMCAQSILLVFNSLHFDLEVFRSEPHIAVFASSMVAITRTLFHLDLRLAEIGAVASLCVAIYIHFGKSRLDMSKTLPGTSLLDPPEELRGSVGKIARRAGVAYPEVSLVDSGIPSAFTFRHKGRYVVALTVGLLESFDESEVEACIAHEIAHLRNRDFLVRSLATLAKIALFAKPLSYLIEPAVYRAREFLADKTAASLMGTAVPLISVLSKLREQTPSTFSPSLGVCSCCLSGRVSSMRIFDKHPDLNSRIQLLQELQRSRFWRNGC
jgi:heat shock protein HtpX